MGRGPGLLAQPWALLLVASSACASGAAPTGTVGSSIALLGSGGDPGSAGLAVVNPDQGSVSFLDAATLAVISTVTVAAEPRALLLTKSGALWVLSHRGGALTILDPVAMSVTTALPLCPGPSALAESADGTWVAVSCEWSGAVLRVDEATRSVTTLATGLTRPQGVTVIGASVVVAEYTKGRVTEISPTAPTVSVSLVPTAAPYRSDLTQMNANLASAVLPAFGHVFVAHELVNNTGTLDGGLVSGNYGTVVNDDPKINAAVTRLSLSGESVAAETQTPPTYSQFDTAAHISSGPVALAAFGDHFLLVAHVSTNDVAVLDTTATDPSQRLVATYAVGAGPSGLAVDSVAQVAFVDNAFDGSVSRIDLSQPRSVPAPAYGVLSTLVRGLPSPYSAAALAGRQLFYDATNPHVTPSRVVACATCHPGGSDDGLVWFIDTPTIPLKRRRTPHLANSHTDTAPFHWDGSFATMSDLVNATITGLMAGDDLLVDPTSVQAFVDEMVLAPIGPMQDAASVARGLGVQSASAGCAVCHSGPDFTDDLDHAVLNPESLSADDVFTAANTPALHGLFVRAPFFHDGRAPDLMNLLTRGDATGHGDVSGLSTGDLTDLVAYLQSL